MVFGFFRHGKMIDRLRGDIQESFDHVKRDFNKVGEWIKHIDEKHGANQQDIDYLKEQMYTIQKDLIEIKDFISFFSPQAGGKLSKQASQGRDKQTGAVHVQTPVQTAVQTEILENLTVMERAIVWALLNSEMNLSYEDLSALLGKDKSTIRGQINSIRQKADALIEEIREPNGKKRVYIPERIKAEVMKSIKVRVKRGKSKKSES